MPPALSPQTKSHIYIVGADDGPQKIGISSFPNIRRRQLKPAGSAHLKLHHVVQVPFSSALEIEALAHWLLRAEALGKERFAVSPTEAYRAICDAVARHSIGERAPDTDTVRVQIVAPTSWVERVESFRATQRVNSKMPNASAVIRQLVEEALDARERAAPKPRP